MISSNHEFPKVKQNFEAYEAFRTGGKITAEDDLTLDRKNGNLEYKAGTAINAEGLQKRCRFEAVRSPKSLLKFGFRIFAEDFGQAPCLRFCSRGHVHMNPEGGKGLSARAIPSPHFHKVESDGILRAYQTLPLLNPEESALIISDLTLGVNCFCQEMNLRAPSGGHVVLKIYPEELGLSMDPLDGAKFPTRHEN